MACHLAGSPLRSPPTAPRSVTTTSGLAAAAARYRRDVRRVVFTFDGDAAGQRAALKAFDTDRAFVAQTFVAVEADGRDPCELRLAEVTTLSEP